jgi:DNA-binding beta-propeller fold protein YncE
VYRLIAGILSVLFAAIAAGLIARPSPRYGIRLPATEIFVGNHEFDPETSAGISVTTYPGAAHGDAVPSAELNTNNPTALVRDSQSNMFVASDVGNQVLVYSPGVTGPAPPIRNIQGLNTGLLSPTGLALDAAARLYVAESGAADIQQSAVLIFAADADGDVAPVAKIPSIIPVPGMTGASNTRLQRARGIAVDTAGRIYVADDLAECLLIFAADANGDVAPLAVITNGLSSPQQVALDPYENVYVTNGGSQSVAVFQAHPTSGASPMRMINSPDFNDPFGIAIDLAQQIYVANTSGDNILIFGPGASGRLPALRKIEGSDTRLKAPLAVAVRLL